MYKRPNKNWSSCFFHWEKIQRRRLLLPILGGLAYYIFLLFKFQNKLKMYWSFTVLPFLERKIFLSILNPNNLNKTKAILSMVEHKKTKHFFFIIFPYNIIFFKVLYFHGIGLCFGFIHKQTLVFKGFCLF